MIALTLEKADNFVEKQKRRNVDVRWDGWNMVFFRQHDGALRSPEGRHRGGEWGFETIVSPNDEGQYLVAYKLTRGNKKVDSTRR